MTSKLQQIFTMAMAGLASATLIACNTTALDLSPTPNAQIKPRGTSIDRSSSQTQLAATTQSGSCLSPGQTGDPDIIRNASKLPTDKYCIKLADFSEGGFPWKIFRITSRKARSGPFWAVPHDDEDAAFDSAVYGMLKYGGSIATVEAGESRSFRGQDTNRNFGTTSAIARRCNQQRAAAPKFVQEFMKDHRRGGLIVALHSNTNGYSGNGGAGTISINRQSRIMRPYKSTKAVGLLADEDNLILTASKNLVERDPKLQKLVNHFNNSGVHIIVEHVTQSKNDCSMSNYVILNNLGTYYNIEVQDGAVSAQKELINRLMSYGGR